MLITYQAPISKLKIEIANEELVALDYISTQIAIKTPKTKLGKSIFQQLDCYFKNPKFEFSLPIHLQGTHFQKAVWALLQQIPPGSTRTYGDLAKQLKSSPRAVGNACRANPIAIIVPCHRVVGKDNMGGYGGATTGMKMDKKLRLLQHESAL